MNIKVILNSPILHTFTGIFIIFCGVYFPAFLFWGVLVLLMYISTLSLVDGILGASMKLPSNINLTKTKTDPTNITGAKARFLNIIISLIMFGLFLLFYVVADKANVHYKEISFPLAIILVATTLYFRKK